MRYNLFSLLLLSMCCFFAACDSNNNEPEDPEIPFKKHAAHTLLLYMNADSSLDSDLQLNINDAHKAIKDSLNAGSLNLVVFHDYRTPKLYWVHKNSRNGLDTIPLKEYTAPVDACSKEVLKEVLDITFKQNFSDSKYKGLVFGGHALGWTPSKNYKEPVASTRQIGIDERTGVSGYTGYMELWDFCDALKETNTKLNYLFFDACNMGNIEVAYQLRGLTDYMVGAPTEIQGKGFPYKTVIKQLGSCTNESQFEHALDVCIDAYYSDWTMNSGASISLIDVRNVTQFYNDFYTLLNNSPLLERLQDLLANGSYHEVSNWQSNFQQFGRDYAGSQYYFYDLGQFINYLDPDNKYGQEKALISLYNLVPINYYTHNFYEISIKECSGISISYPQSLKYLRTSRNKELMSAYRRIDWGAEMLRVLNY